MAKNDSNRDVKEKRKSVSGLAHYIIYISVLALIVSGFYVIEIGTTTLPDLSKL